MSGSYFTPENAMQRFFYLQGLTADEFYTDSGMGVDLEWLLFKELQKNGYERIIFYDRHWKLYYFDDISMELTLRGRKTEKSKASAVEKKEAAPAISGLKKGKWGKKKGKKADEKASSNPQVKKEDDVLSVTAENGDSSKEKASADFSGHGIKSGIQMQELPNEPLHSGMQDNEMVYRQIDACMRDAAVKTAVVINDANDFIRDLGQERQHNIHNYMKLPSENQNIMIFIYSDQKFLSLLEIGRSLEDESQPQGVDYSKMLEVISICTPNALELCNMLNYFRLAPNLRVNGKRVNLNVKVNALLDIALELKRYMSESETPFRVKQLYHRLLGYAASGELLTADNCYKLFGEKKHLTGEEQLNRLIGMQDIKDKLTKFTGKHVSSEEKVRYLTSSRLQPDLPVPTKKDMMHVILTGNPGTGKTTVAKLLGQLYFEMGYLSSGHVVETDRAGLVAGYIGQTAILTRARVMEALGGVLFVDEAYSLKKEEDSGSRDFGQEAIDTLVKAMDEFSGQFILVAAGYQKEMERFINANPGLERRFRLHLHIEDYTPEEMRKILELHVKERNCRFSEAFAAKLDDFCENWVNLAGENWGNGGEAVKLAANLELGWENDEKHRIESADGMDWRILEERYLPKEMLSYLQPVAKMREGVMEELNALPGLSYVKEQIEKIRKRMIMGDVSTPGHYIFSGNPGTGKTTVARYMGRILRNHGLLKRGHLVEYTAGDLVNLVDSGRSFAELAHKALDGVLFIDEAYQLLASGSGQRIISDLVPFMENNHARLCVICAGYEEDMERFLAFNTGLKDRFSEIILFENYTGQELASILYSMLEAEGYQLDSTYREYSLRALTRYADIRGQSRDFGNARYIREKYIPHSLDARNTRLFEQYGETVPREVKKLLTGEDIPAELVKYTKEKLPEKDNRSAIEKIDALIGYEGIKAELRRLLISARFRQEDGSGARLVPETLHWVLMGNPGTGKTTIAKLVGQVYKECGLLSKGHTVKVTRSDLVSEYMGQTAIKTRRMIEKAMDGILFIDEAYALTKGEVQGGGYGLEAITEIVEAMTDRNGEFAVIAAGYPGDMEDFLRSNDGLARRFKIFNLEDYTPSELHQILVLKCREAHMELEPSLDEKMDLFFANYKNKESKKRVWGNGGEAEDVLRSMQHVWFEHPFTRQDEDGTIHRILTEEHLPKELQSYLKGKLKEEKKKESALERVRSMIGFAEVKTVLEDLLRLGDLSKQEGMEDLREDNTLHWILKGNPGTGKTTVAKLVGEVYKEIGLLERGHCIKVTRADLCGEYIGQTAQKTRKCIERAMGGVLFIDEAYMLKRRGEIGGDYGQEAIDTILEAMSDKNGLFAVIAAGYPREMDVFLNSNPGFASRFSDNIFMLEDYTAEELVQIFESISTQKNFLVSEELRKLMLSVFENMLKARIKNWANGREAENLQKQMRIEWAKAPVIKTDDKGTKIRVFTPEHLPDKYKKYLPAEKTASKEGKESKKQDTANEEYKLPFAVLPGPKEGFDYDKDLPAQEQGLAFIRGLVEDAQGRQGYSFGSGFLMTSDGYILTCNHVVENCKSMDVMLRIPGRSDGDISWHQARIVRTSRRLDAALLKIDVMQYPVLPMRPREKETVNGEPIYHMGYPFGAKLSDNTDELRPSLFQGYISSIQIKNGLERINTDMAAKRGCSGGPVLSKADGTVIGILCGSQTESRESLTEEINYVLPVKYIWEEMVQMQEE